jgi:putative FmdB family regulatory protein
MPLYEYECVDCGQRTEALQQHSDPPLTVCPACGGKLRKLVSSPSFQFKGSGWYVTDYARAKPEAKAGKSDPGSGDAKAPATGGGGGEGDGKSKADAPADPKPAAAKPVAAKDSRSDG